MSDAQTTITREEWERRYAARVQARAGWSADEAAECARVGAESFEYNERAAGKAVVWSGSGRESPEHLADDEMSYWDDDGDD